MKKIFLYLLVIVCIAVNYVYAVSIGGKVSSAKVDNIIKLLPSDIDLIVKIKSIKHFYEYFSINENSFLGEPIDNIEAIKNIFEFNPLKISQLESNGFNTSQVCGIGVNSIKLSKTDINKSCNLLVFLPVINAQKAITALKKIIQNKNPMVQFSFKAGLTFFENAENGLNGAFIEQAGFIFIGINIGNTDNKSLMTSFISSRKSLADLKIYKDIADKIDTYEDIFVYANINKIVNYNFEFFKTLSNKALDVDVWNINKTFELLKNYEGLGFCLNLDHTDFKAKGVVNMVSGSDAFKIIQNLKFNKKTVLGLKENPCILVSGAVNFQQYYKLIVDSLPEQELADLNFQLKKWHNNFGIDVEKEIIQHIQGNLNFGIYDSMRINLANYNALITLNIKNETKIKNTMEKLFVSLSQSQENSDQQKMIHKTKIGKTDAYYARILGIMHIYAGIKDNNLIFSLGQPMFEKALNADMTSGFLSNFNKELSEVLKGDTGVFYINIGEVYNALKNFNMLIQQIQGINIADEKFSNHINKLEYILISNKVKNNSMYFDFVIKTKFSEPFLKGIQKIAKEFKQPQEVIGNE